MFIDNRFRGENAEGGPHVHSRRNRKNLPDDDDEAFGVAEELCRKKAFGRSDISGSHEDQLRYIDLVRKVASELGIQLPQAARSESDILQYESASLPYAHTLRRFAEAQRTASVLRNRRKRDENSVLVSSATRERIKNRITSLRDMIDASNLPDWQKSKLHQRLDDLVTELDQRRMSFLKTMIILTTVAGSLGGAVSGLAEAPQASELVGRIVALLGHDKKAEDDERERLTAPPKALPSPPTNPNFARFLVQATDTADFYSITQSCNMTKNP